ncbi:hypothetical protein BH18ACI3_BH18ACI3_10990 [soil metagenome]
MMKEFTTKQDKYIDWRWQAVQTKNREFDGVFYTGVQTTGIFCRPSCPAKIPKRQMYCSLKVPMTRKGRAFAPVFAVSQKMNIFRARWRR